MKSIALYARVSSEQQAQQATIDSQVAALRERAGADGHAILPGDVYVDDGFSGASLIRPALERLRDRVAEGRLDVIYVHSPDRLARRYAYQVLLLDEFSQHGIDVVFLHGPAGHSAEDELLVQVQGMIAEYERAKILERCRRGKLHRARNGMVNPLSGAPYGYNYVRKTDAEPARYQVLLHEARVVKWIFEWFADEQLSIGAITRRLRERDVPTRTGKAVWDRTTVWGMLRNPAYVGRAAFGKTESVPRGKVLRPLRGRESIPRDAKTSSRDRPVEDWISISIPAIVSSSVFEAAQEQLDRNRRLAKRNGRGERYLLQGLTVCSSCGYAFYGKTVTRHMATGSRRYGYYRCTGTDAARFEGGRICAVPQIRADQLDDYVWESVKQVLQDPERVLAEWSRRSSEDCTVAALVDLRDKARHHLAVQQGTLKRIVDAYEAGAIDLDDLSSRAERARIRIQLAQRELEQAQTSLTETVELHEVVATITTFADQVRAGLDGADWHKRQQIIRALVTRVEIDIDGATVIYRVPGTSHPPDGSPHTDDDAPSSPDTGDSSSASPGSCLLRWRRHQPVVGELLPALVRQSLLFEQWSKDMGESPTGALRRRLRHHGKVHQSANRGFRGGEVRTSDGVDAQPREDAHRAGTGRGRLAGLPRLPVPV